MSNNAQRYLNLIAQHLQAQRASILVGSGFSRNAVKNPDIPPSPLWNDLAKLFKDALDPDGERADELSSADPLTLAEHVEIAFGRPELDQILLRNIRDLDYQPSLLHKTLLQLPWSDIFTTNYDTLLERASENVTEKAFTVITNKEDLLGSSGMTRIVKLHGSFPSHRPFIITAEDYRTYPQEFAPFVNTVQQSLIENTLVLIGFSGDDPNFNHWIGWIRDNYGAKYKPNMYMLLHETPSDTRREWLQRRNIVPVDLSEIFKYSSPSQTYEAALDYLLKEQNHFNQLTERWEACVPKRKDNFQPLSVHEALPKLRENRENCPRVLTPKGEQMAYQRNQVIKEASRTLLAHCRSERPDTTDELDYLYEYDWLCSRLMYPLSDSEIVCYCQILEHHTDVRSIQKSAILLSMLRTFRENGEWAEWKKIYEIVSLKDTPLTSEQHHQLQWEECLIELYHYDFKKLKKKLDAWIVTPNTPLWVLRKAGLMVQYGDCTDANTLLQLSILDIRKILSHQTIPDRYLLSLESALMFLQRFISQSTQNNFLKSSEEDKNQIDNDNADAQRLSLHEQYHVSWETRNQYYVHQLITSWVPYSVTTKKATFDFGRIQVTNSYREDTDRIIAYSFLRFREECGIPFRIRSTYSDKDAACGAAERLALIQPQRSILVLVQADESKKVESVLTRALLSSWTQKETDQICQFYLDAVHRTEDELSEDDWHLRNGFARLAANVLPEVLSLLCVKCSSNMLDRLIDWLEHMYQSPKKMCYQQALSLTKRLIPVYYSINPCRLIDRLLNFPVICNNLDIPSHYFVDPFPHIPLPAEGCIPESPTERPEITALFGSLQTAQFRMETIDRLIRCAYLGLLTARQKNALGDLLWDDGKITVPDGFLRTVTLALPSSSDICVRDRLRDSIVDGIQKHVDGGVSYRDEFIIVREFANFALTDADCFTSEQVSSILQNLSRRVSDLSECLDDGDEFIASVGKAKSELFCIARALWILTAKLPEWLPSDHDRQAMESILDAFQASGIEHYGLKKAWHPLLGHPEVPLSELASNIRSLETLRCPYNYDILYTAVQYLESNFLTASEIHFGIEITAQHLVWGIHEQVDNALRVVNVVVRTHCELLNAGTRELILSGLSTLKSNTEITRYDTIKAANEKGSIRKEAAALAWQMMQHNLGGDHPEILTGWCETIQNPDEFVEVRAAQYQ